MITKSSSLLSTQHLNQSSWLPALRCLLLCCSAAFIFQGCHKASSEGAPPSPTPPGPQNGVQPGASPQTLKPSQTENYAALNSQTRSGDSKSGSTSNPRRVACGNTQCNIPEETCCANYNEGACVPTVPPGPHDHQQPLAAQANACEAAPLQYSLDRIIQCDESIDCSAGSLCCEQMLWGGASASVCAPQGTPCDFHERCIDGQPCRSPGAICIEGKCHKDLGKIKCGSNLCNQRTQICCGENPQCVERATEGGCEIPNPKYECFTKADCLPTQFCISNFFSNYCSGWYDIANTLMVCVRDEECPIDTAFCPNGWECKAKPETTLFKTCGCK